MQTKRKNRGLRRFWPAALWILGTPGLLPAVDFNAPRGFQVGYSAALAVADLNGDGNPDLVSADEYSNNVSILLGNGDGGFQPAIDYAVGDKVGAVVVGDFNGDGKLDLAVASLTPHTISILFGNGDGTFQPAIVSIQGLSVFAASSLVVGDFNGDGKLDLAAGAVFAGNFEGVAIFLGNGDGTFNRQATYGFEQPLALALADFNGDGKPDLAVGFGNGATVLLGNGNGTFHPSASFDFNYVSSLAVADFNGDGKPDLVLTASAVTVLLGKGNGSFQPPLNYSLVGYGVVAGDFNGDGKPDLAVSSTNTAGNISGTLSILRGLGNGTFQPLGTYSVPSTLPVVADFNRDGALDLAMGNGAAALILLGNGQGGFEHPSNHKAGIKNPTALATGDFDGDGKQDLAVVNSVSQTVSVILASGQTHNYSLPFAAESLAVGDFNLDGKLDIAVGFAILLGNGDGTFQLTANYGPATSVVVGDFNGDGKPDLAGNAGGFDKLLLGNGDGTFQPPQTAGGGLVVYQAAGDFNGDGKSDLAVLSNYYSTYTLSILLGHGDGTFEVGSTFVFDAPIAPTSVALGDFNGDGKLDLALSVWNDQSISVYLGNGDGTLNPAVSYDAGGGEPELLVVADFNADGKQDLAVYSFGSHSVAILAGRGDGTFARQQVSFEACAFPLIGSLTPQGMAVLDFNGDGKPDLALVNYSLDSVIVLTNTTP